LYYYRARYYSPQLGRFISEDPDGIGGGSNYYAYVDGNPVDLTDPLGLWSISVSRYSPYGGGVVVIGTGLHFTSVTVKVGVGIGGGFSFNRWGGPPDPCAPGGSNGMGVFVEGALSALIVSLGGGYNAGISTWTDSNGTVHYHPCSGAEPEFSGEHGGDARRVGPGIEAEASGGFEWTKYF